MERIINDNEKIKRAEEIYFRRNNKNYSLETQNIKSSFGKEKFLLRLLVMFNLAIIVFSIQNKDYIFTKEFLRQMNEYNINITEVIKEKFKEILKEEESNGVERNDVLLENDENSVDIINEELVSTISEMELDINNLNAAYSFIKPLEGIVSSKFGARESKFQNVSGYHTGTDIAAPSGTPIIASMEGIVDLVSSKGDYGNHVKIRCNNVTTLYAHCLNINVKEGQIVAQGQEIGKVGSTGNSTGPHLHFEIRIDNRFVDPSKVLVF